MELLAQLQAGLAEIGGVTIHGTSRLDRRVATLSITVGDLDPGETSRLLDAEHGIQTRSGLQCAPLIHEHMGTAPRGTVRMSIGPYNTKDQIETAVRAVGEIAAAHCSTASAK